MTGALAGRVCVVTGASSGIGAATALGLAKLDATVLMVCRDAGKGEAARARIAAASGNPSVEVLLADLSSQASIRRLVYGIRRRSSRLDVLVNNAGAVFSRRQETADGMEMTFALNHLAYFLLSNLLIDQLAASVPARIVNVTSEIQRRGRIDFDDLQMTRRYSGWRAYGQSKLANILFTYEFARRLEGSGITVNCVHPGAVRTDFGRRAGGLLGLLTRLARPLERSPEQGADSVVWLASSPAAGGVSGKYYADRRERRSQRTSYDPELARRLWEISVRLTDLLA